MNKTSEKSFVLQVSFQASLNYRTRTGFLVRLT